MKKVTLAISLFLISMFYVFFVNAYAEGTKTGVVTPERLEFDIATETETNITTYAATSVDGFTFDSSTGTIIRYTPTADSPTNLVMPSQIDGVIVKAIGNYAFSNCTSLTSIEIPNGVTSIGDYAFAECTNLGIIKMSNSIISIGEWAFSDCENLISIEIPSSVTSIGDIAFLRCSKLKAINVDINNKKYSSDNGILFNKEKTTLIQYPIALSPDKYSIPNNVTSIGDCSFMYSNLTTIEIPSSVTSIGREAFEVCKKLTTINIPNSVTSIGDYTFSECTSLTTIEIPDSITSIGDEVFAFCTSLTTIEIPNSVTSIGDYTFSECYNLAEIKIYNNIVFIDDFVFELCTNLKSVYCYKGSTADNRDLYPNSNVTFYYLDKMIDFKIKDAECRAGEEVDVYVSVDKNSGMAVYDLKVNFDKTKVTPVSITQINSDEISGGLVSNLLKPSVSAESLDYVTAVWSNASNVTYNGDLFKIRFKIKDDVLYSEVPITLEFNEDGLLDENYEELTPSITNGKITVYPPYEFGDINMDGKINARDLLMLTQYLAEYNNITFNSSQAYLADVYKDGNIDLLDLLLLKQYLAGWDVVLGETIAQNISLFSGDSISLDLNSEYISDDEIKVSVSAKDNPGIAAFKLKLKYDNTALTPVSLTKGTAVTGSITTNINSLNENSNYVTALWSDVVNNNNDGVLYSVVFKVKDNSNANTKLSVTCSDKDIINETFGTVSANKAEKQIEFQK